MVRNPLTKLESSSISKVAPLLQPDSFPAARDALYMVKTELAKACPRAVGRAESRFELKEGDAYKKGRLSLDKTEGTSITRTKRTEGFNVQLLTTFAGPKSRTSSNEHSRTPKHGFCKKMLSTWKAGDWTHRKTRNLDCERTSSGSRRKSSDWLLRRRPQIRTKKKKKKREDKLSRNGKSSVLGQVLGTPEARFLPRLTWPLLRPTRHAQPTH